MNARSFNIAGEAEMRALAARLLSEAGPRPVFALTGGLGAGKTRFAQGIARALDVADLVSSPTFALVQQYATARPGEPFVHMDLYRLSAEEEAVDLGFEELVETAAATVVEWPQVAEALLPPRTVRVHIDITGDDTRTVSVR